uniref:Uncharacterized protein n=1 Tax=Brassica oleracea TaxID=3712 RepID=A0A3P6F974_BRAOL|nr:unnamed protein product [Brassica oleracea]
MFSGAGDAFSRRRWLLVATSSSTCISLLSFRSSSRVLCCSRSLYLSIGAPMVSSRPKVSSTPLFYGDSRSVNLCRSFTRRLTLYSPPHRGLISVSSNRRSVYFILSLSMSLRLEDPHRRSPSISSQAHSQTTTSDVLTVVSGIPHKTRFLDPKLFQFRVMGSPSLISLTTVAGHSREIEETFSTDDTAAAVLPQALHSSITFGDLMYCIGGIFHHQGVPPSGATLSAVPVTRIPPNSVASHRASSASLFQQVHCFHSPHLLSNHLPVGSLGSPSPPLASVLVKKRTVLSNTSLLKSVSLPNIKWKSPSISITDLLSCGAVRSGPEDAADFVSSILRGADWVLTSPFHVTISQLSNCVVKALSTHLSLVLNSLSSSDDELSILSAFGIVVYLFNQRGWYIPTCYCNQNN